MIDERHVWMSLSLNSLLAYSVRENFKISTEHEAAYETLFMWCISYLWVMNVVIRKTLSYLWHHLNRSIELDEKKSTGKVHLQQSFSSCRSQWIQTCQLVRQPMFYGGPSHCNGMNLHWWGCFVPGKWIKEKTTTVSMLGSVDVVVMS